MTECSRSPLSREQIESLLRDFKAELQVKLAADDAHQRIETFAQKHYQKGASESAAVGAFIVPALFEVIRRIHGEEASQIVLTENEVARRELGLPNRNLTRALKHPFTKGRDDPLELFERWACGRLPESTCPDAALGPPYRVIFEAKYFVQDALSTAKRALVEGLYQTVFYRGLPQAEASNPRRKAHWHYEYGCFVAIDTTGKLLEAWAQIERVSDEFWRSANVYPVLVGLPRGPGRGQR